MHHRLAVFASVLLMAAGFSFSPPAQAHVDICAVTGTMVTTASVFENTRIARMTHANFAMTAQAVCAAHIISITGTGHFLSFCTDGAVQGVIHDGVTNHAFDALWSGHAWQFVGPGVDGTLDVTADATRGESCFTGGADQFVVTGTLAFS